MRRDYFVFGGVNSLEYDVWLTDARTEDTPAKDVQAESVAGKNGDFLSDNGRWNNVEVPYGAAILHDFTRKYEALMAALGSQKGYQRLEDSVRPHEFRLGTFRAMVQPKNTPYNLAGEFDIVFFCKPQRFLKIGEHKISFTAPGTLHNPTAFAAQPLITVHGAGAGVLTVGDRTVTVKDLASGSIVLDCEIGNAYLGTTNLNKCIHAPDFPELAPGKNEISWTGDITGVDIIPRWWTL